MKRFFVLLIGVLVLSSLNVYAAVVLQDDGTTKGTVEKINVKGAATTRSGQTGTVDLAGINWTYVGGIGNSSINWTDFKTQAQAAGGVNWQAMTTVANGVNWSYLSGTATSGQLMCWTSTGRPGKCTGGVSGNNCVTCN